jgi:hypothetical protein
VESRIDGERVETARPTPTRRIEDYCVPRTRGEIEFDEVTGQGAGRIEDERTIGELSLANSRLTVSDLQDMK